MKQKLLKTLVLLCALIVGSATSWADTATINFGSATGSTSINAASKTGDDSQGNEWTITTVGTTSFTPNASYAQVGSSNKPATSITFTTTLANDVNVTSFSAKFGGFNGTAGTVTLKVGDTTVGTGSLNASNDVTVTSSSAQTGKTLTVTVTGISKGVKCYYISYTYTSGSSDPVAVTGVSLNKSSLNLEVGGNATLTATVAPADATDKVVTWESSDEDVATVVDGVVTAEGAGSATITVTTHDGSFTATCDVTVTLAPEATLTFDFTDDAWGFPESYILTNQTYTNDGYTITLGASSGGHKVMTSGGKITALIWGKVNATLSLPAFPFNVSKIKVYGNSGASGKVTFNVFVDDAAVSTGVTSSLVDHEFDIEADKQSAGTIYTLKLTNDNNCQISKIEVFGYEPVTVSAVGYATYCSANALDFTGAGVKAYVGTVSGGNLTFTPVTEVPANTGLLLYKEGGATVNVPVIASAAAVSENCLTGVNTATTISSDDYILNKVGEDVGFYKAGSFTSLAAHRAYITSTAAASIKNFVLNFDETDGISVTMRDEENEKDGAIYNLAGQRVTKATKGIYVKNGRKFIVK